MFTFNPLNLKIVSFHSKCRKSKRPRYYPGQETNIRISHRTCRTKGLSEIFRNTKGFRLSVDVKLAT